MNAVTHPKIPPLSTLLKSSEVEDPVNVYVHRRLAYAFVAATWKTRITPNMITFAAMMLGITAAVMWLVGTDVAMVIGAFLLWSSAILDGADGFLARAKNMTSRYGRALDGAADAIVAFVTVTAAGIHIWQVTGSLYLLLALLPAIILTVVHLSLYDFYKETYLRMTRPSKGGEGEWLDEVAADADASRADGLVAWVAVKHFLVGFLTWQHRMVTATNANAWAVRNRSCKDDQTAETYRAFNKGPMRLWALISLAPHTYLLCLCAMANRLDIYLWIRLIPMNIIMVVAIIWQRRATVRTNEALGGVVSLETIPAAA